MKIIPSIASANQTAIAEELRRLGEVPLLHIDIEDGNFVPNITFGLKTIRQIRAITSIPFDTHLMVTNPEDYIDPLHELGAISICFHWEATEYPLKLLGRIRSLGMNAGIAFNVKTDVDCLKYCKDDLDFVLLMTSEPDGMGECFRPAVIDKLKKAKDLLRGKAITIDGGLGENELKACRGLYDRAIVGRAVFSSDHPEKTIEQLNII